VKLQGRVEPGWVMAQALARVPAAVRAAGCCGPAGWCLMDRRIQDLQMAASRLVRPDLAERFEGWYRS